MDAKTLLTHSCPIIRDVAKKAIRRKIDFQYRDFNFLVGDKDCKLTPDYYLNLPVDLPFFCNLHYNFLTDSKSGIRKGWALKITALEATNSITMGIYPLDEFKSIGGILADKK